MNVLFVNPYIYDFTAYDLWLRPLGNLYLASILDKYTDVRIFWIDVLDRFQPGSDLRSGPYGTGKYHREIVEKPLIYRNVPRNYSRYGIPLELFRKKMNDMEEIDIIFVTTLMTYWVDGVNFTIRELKKRFRKAEIIVGGLLPSLIGRSVRDFIDGDHFIYGRGENQIVPLIGSRGARVKNFPNFDDIDNIPFPRNEFLSNRRILPLLTSRGCPFRCTYCATFLLNRKFSQRDPLNVSGEILYMNEKFGTEHFVIFDDAFLVNRDSRLFRVLDHIKGAVEINFHTPNGIHCREIDEKTASRLFQAGFKTIRLSFESTDEDILARSSNKVNTPQMISAVENLAKAGYKKKDIECYIMAGLPGQTFESIERSLQFAAELGIRPRISYFSPIPGTVEFKALEKKKIFSAENLPYQTNKIYYLYEHSGLTEKEIKNIGTLVIDIGNDA